MQKKVLLADDDADDREIFERVLGKKEDVVLLKSAKNGREVIDYLALVDDPESLPDLIILDHNMPKMTGLETLEQLKSTPQFKNIAVVIYSTYSDNRMTERCLGVGAAMVLSKPATMREYEAVIDQFLKIVNGPR